MSAVERAAEVIFQRRNQRTGETRRGQPVYQGYDNYDIARALADAGLLVTDADRAVLDAAEAEVAAWDRHHETHMRVLFHGGHPSESSATREAHDDALNLLRDVVHARREATS